MCYKNIHPPGEKPIPSDKVHRSVFFRSSPLVDVFLQLQMKSSSKNVFDKLPALIAPTQSDLCDKLECYLSSDPEHVGDVLMWWFERQQAYLSLSRMAMDYLSIPGA